MQKYNRGKRSQDNYKNKDNKNWKDKKRRKNYKQKEIKGLAVVPYENESIERVIKRFKKVVDSAGIMRELKRREFHMSKSQKRREKKKRALKRLRKRERMMRRFQRD